MRFVKTPEEIQRIQKVYAQCHFMGMRGLSVLFETDPDAVQALLPPPLEPTPEPLGTAWVGEVAASNCVGPFRGAAVYLRARYGDIVGNYCLTMPMSTPEAVVFGRELYGEPKKVAAIIFETQGDHVWGSAERRGVRFLSLRGRVTREGRPGRTQTSTFHFKFTPRPDGHGFDSPPRLVRVVGDVTVQVARLGRGELVFRDSAHDPIADIPVRQVVEAVYTEGHMYTSGHTLCEVDPEAFRPYSFASIDDLDEIAEGGMIHAQAARRTREGKGQWRGR